MSEPTLGDILRARLKSEEADKCLKLEREAREAGEKAQRDLRTVREFFEDAKVHFKRCIMDGTTIVPIQVGRREREDVASVLQTYQSIQVNHLSHKYYALWENFSRWANANGLVALWIDQHDGGGMESWRLLSIKPT